MKSKHLFEGFSIFALIALILISILISISVGASLLMVLIGLSPSLFLIILSIIIFENSKRSKLIIWVTPVILLILFFFVGSSKGILSANLNVGTLMAVNLIISIIYVVIALLLAKIISKDRPVKKESIKSYISSIEDKSKALNFAIGRVYSKHHGGSKELREKILIKPSWYAEFSIDSTKENRLKALDKIGIRLASFKKSEKEILGNVSSLKKLKRNKLGNDSVIDVLKNNDKDPVDQYYEGALNFCNELRRALQR